MVAKKPCHFDTESFVFEYDVKKDTLHVRIKNEDVSAVEEDLPYVLDVSRKYGVVGVKIHQIFGDGTVTPDQHIAYVTKSFTPWLKSERDARYELHRGIFRFYALAAFDAFEFGPDQFEKMKETLVDLLAQIKNDFPAKIEEYSAMQTAMQTNALDEARSFANGCTIFCSIDKIWIVEESREQQQEIPEYIWKVRQFEYPGVEQSCKMLYSGGNNDCIAAVMQTQRELYGICDADVKGMANKINNVKQTIQHAELILETPEKESLLNELS